MKDLISALKHQLKQLKYTDTLKPSIEILKNSKMEDLELLTTAKGTSRLLAGLMCST